MILSKIIKKGYLFWQSVSPVVTLLQSSRPYALLFGIPLHSNVGDQAQLRCIRRWIAENYPERELIEFSWRASHGFMLKVLKWRLKPEDRIFFHSGYLLTDHHLEFPVFCRVAKLFQTTPIVVLPQTILIREVKNRELFVSCFDSHPDLTLLCRDQVSLASARGLLKNCKLLLYPDIVTSMIATRVYDFERSGVLICVRNDKEKHYSDEQIRDLEARFGEVEVELMDTSIHVHPYRLSRDFNAIFEQMLLRFSKAKVVITDRYHGTIFSLIASTPVVVLGSADHKLESGVKWFPDSFSDYVHFAKDLDEAYKWANCRLQEVYIGCLDNTYFNAEYYSRLRSLLSEQKDGKDQ